MKSSPSFRKSESVWPSYDHSKFSEVFKFKNSSIQIQNSNFKPQNGLGGKFPVQDQVDLGVDYVVDLPKTRSTIVSTRVLGGNFPAQPGCLFWILKSEFLNFGLVFIETYKGLIFFVRSPLYANLDSIPSRISRRTLWRNPFPLILNLKFNSALICES